MIHRVVHKSGNYSVVSLYHLKDKKLSLQAKGLLTLMLTLPDDWDFSINGLVAVSGSSIDRVKSAIKELRESKYVFISNKRDEHGRVVEWQYDIFEEPQPEVEKPHVENPHEEKPHVENPLQSNIKESNIKESNIKESNIKKSNIKRFIPPTVEEVAEFCKSRGSIVNPEEFVDFYTAQGWKLSNGQSMKDWQSAVKRWERTNRHEEPTRGIKQNDLLRKALKKHEL